MHDNKQQLIFAVVTRCAFVISASFSEGSSTGVITGMAMGCVPVVSPFCGTEFFEGVGVTFTQMSAQGILNAMHEVEAKDGAMTQLHRRKMMEYVRDWYSVNAYRARLSTIIQKCLQDAGQ